MKRLICKAVVILLPLLLVSSCQGTQEDTTVENTDFTYEFNEKYQLHSRINLFNEEKIPMDTLCYQADKDTHVVLESGSFINIPADAFLDESGNIYEGTVNVSYREYNDPVAFLASGLPMTIGADEENIEVFESAGMFDFQATSDQGEDLQPDPEKKIEFGIASNKTEDYPLWKFEEGEGWQEAEDPEILDEQKIDSAANIDIPPVPKPDRVNSKSFKITSKLVEDKSHLKPYEGWSFIATDPDCESKMVHYCKNVEVEKLGGGLYNLIITLWTNQKVNCECKRYQGEAGYAKKLEEYNKKWAAYARYRQLMREVQYRFKENGNTVLRKINLTKTGTFNCDIVSRIPWTDYSFEYVQGYNNMDVALYCIDFTLGLKYACVNGETIGIYHENDYAVIGVTEDKILYSSQTSCSKAFSANHFTFDLIEMDKDTDINEIYAKLKG